MPMDGHLAPGATGPGSQTPVFDNLVTEYRANFRSVPGDPWEIPPLPQIAGGPERYALPGGSPGL
jgi:hypothetical protein